MSVKLASDATWLLSDGISLYGEFGKLWATTNDERTRSGINGNLGLKVLW